MRGFYLILLAFSALSLRAADDETRRFLWSQANTLAAEAQTPAEFRKAATVYRQLLADGVDNAPLLLNFASTLVMAGEPAPALAAFARAECIAGITPESAVGIRAAYARRPQGQPQTPPWPHTVFYPHFFFSCLARTQAAALAFALALLFLFPRRLTSRFQALFFACACFCGAVALICAFSAAISRFETRDLPVLATEAGHV